MGNVSERRKQPPQVGVSVVILALGPVPQSDVGAGAASSGMGSILWMPLVKRVRQPFLGQWALPGGGLRADHSLEQSAYAALESTTSLHPKYLEQLYTFGDPARSHGGLPMVSIVYWALVGEADGRIDFAGGDNVNSPEASILRRKFAKSIRCPAIASYTSCSWLNVNRSPTNRVAMSGDSILPRSRFMAYSTMVRCGSRERICGPKPERHPNRTTLELLSRMTTRYPH